MTWITVSILEEEAAYLSTDIRLSCCNHLVSLHSGRTGGCVVCSCRGWECVSQTNPGYLDDLKRIRNIKRWSVA